MINIPTIAQLYTGILADLEAEYSINIPLVGKNFLRALAAVQAAKLKIAYLHIAKVQKNIFVDTADPESMGGTLERFGRVKLGRSPFVATAGEYTVQLTGTLGATVAAQTQFKSNDGSLNPDKLFILDNAFVLDGIDIVTLRALESGLDSQLSISDGVTAVAPIALVDSLAIVLTEAITPQAPEDIEEYREKALQAYRLEPQGGAGADYRIWAADAQGEAEAYPYAVSGSPNEVNLFVEATIIDSSDGKGTPTAAILTAVQTAIESPTVDRPSRKPLAVFAVNYIAITVREIDIVVTGFVGLTAAQQTLIFNSMKTELSTIRPFVSSIDILADKNDIFDLNKIIAVILDSVPGAIFGAVTLDVDAAPVSTYTFLNGDIPNLNSITYV